MFNSEWFVCVYGNNPQFHVTAKEAGAILTIPGSASSAWFENKEAAESFCSLYAELSGAKGGSLLGPSVIHADSFNLIYHT